MVLQRISSSVVPDSSAIAITADELKASASANATFPLDPKYKTSPISIDSPAVNSYPRPLPTVSSTSEEQAKSEEIVTFPEAAMEIASPSPLTPMLPPSGN